MPEIKRCYRCKWVIGQCADWFCRLLAEKGVKHPNIIIHQQAEQCPEYDPREK